MGAVFFGHMFKTTVLFCGLPVEVEAAFCIKGGMLDIEAVFYSRSGDEIPGDFLDRPAWEARPQFGVVRGVRTPKGGTFTVPRIQDFRYSIRELIERRIMEGGAFDEAQRGDLERLSYLDGLGRLNDEHAWHIGDI